MNIWGKITIKLKIKNIISINQQMLQRVSPTNCNIPNSALALYYFFFTLALLFIEQRVMLCGRYDKTKAQYQLIRAKSLFGSARCHFQVAIARIVHLL